MSTPNTPKQHNTDIIGGVLMLATAAFFQYQMDPDFTDLGAYFPQRLIYGIAALGVGLLIKGFFWPKYLNSFMTKVNPNVVFICIVGLIWVYLLAWVGFILTSIVAMFAILWRLEPKGNRTPVRLAKLLALVVAEVAVVYFVFGKLLFVTLPVGRLWWTLF